MKEYSDYELVSYINENNEAASDIIFEKYKPFIISTAKKFSKHCVGTGIDINDLIQEGYLGLNLAINHFNEQKDTTFYTYCTKCIERKMISAIIGTTRLKHRILNNSLSYESYDDEEYSDIQNLLSDNSYNPELIILNNEELMAFITSIEKKLTPLEKKVFELKISNFSYREIASLLNKKPKAIDNALQRIRFKTLSVMNKK